MTELKIKQADINNNGNQRLVGERGARGGAGYQNMYQLWECKSGCILVVKFRSLFFSLFDFIGHYVKQNESFDRRGKKLG